MQFLTPLMSVALLVALMLVGFILRKVGKIKDPGPMTQIIINVAQPAIVFNLIASSFFRDDAGTLAPLANLGISIGITLVQMSIMLGIGLLIFKRDKRDGHRNISSYCMAFGHIALMGVPVIRLLFPDNYSYLLLFVAGNVIAFNIMQWTLGAWILSGSKAYVKPKKIIFNPAMIAFLLAFPLFFVDTNYITGADATFTDDVTRVSFTLIRLLADFATAAALFIVGIRLAEMKWSDFAIRFRAKAAGVASQTVANQSVAQNDVVTENVVASNSSLALSQDSIVASDSQSDIPKNAKDSEDNLQPALPADSENPIWLDSLKAYIVTFCRVGLAPLVMFLLTWWLPGVDRTVSMALIIVTGMPTAATALLFVENFKRDSYYCTKIVLISKFISVLTIPILMLIFA